MRWPNPPLALALDGANCHVDQTEVLILEMASNYWIDIT
jgi:hypothetical protein